MIKAIVIFFNDTPAMLERCLYSLKDKASEIISIDGAFKDFPHDKPYSTDGCVELAIKESTVCVSANSAWESQVTKRNEAFKYLQDGDYFFVLDADEELIGDLDIKGDYTNIRISEGVRDFWRVRLIRFRDGMKYDGRHSIISYQGQCINHKSMNPAAVDMRDGFILHHTRERSEKRKEEKTKYSINRDEETAPHVYERLKNGYHKP